jgi:pyrrolidone-carboxylate peptidase
MRSLLLMTACTFFAAAGEPVLLLTAFEAREEGGPSTSWEALKDFQGKVFHGHRVETVKLRHDGPGSLDAPLKKAMQDFAPRAVLCFGDGTDKIQIEANAYNTYVDGALDDPNARRSEIVPAGWNQYPAKLPVRTLRNKLREEMEHVSVSGRMTTNTGNDLFYRVAALEPPPTVYGLIQLPRVGAPVPDHPRAWTLDDIKRAVSIAADMAAKHRLFRIQVVGDEYSGEELRPEERWPTQLVEKMRSGGTLSADPTAWLFRQFQAFDLSNLEPIAKDYDLFVLQYGMTDQFKGTHRGKFREATKRILQTDSQLYSLAVGQKEWIRFRHRATQTQRLQHCTERRSRKGWSHRVGFRRRNNGSTRQGSAVHSNGPLLFRKNARKLGRKHLQSDPGKENHSPKIAQRRSHSLPFRSFSKQKQPRSLAAVST